VEPNVVVTYPVHGVSGHPDHLVTHAVVKRGVCALRQDGAAYPQRLAFFTLPPAPDDADRPAHLQHSPSPLIDCVVPVNETDLATARTALDCYATYRPIIEEHRPLQSVSDGVAFEFYAESYDSPTSSLLTDLEGTNGSARPFPPSM
jgi:LmbE family N-acetylglucosaminyl deacetylase